jgi:hypothetical protein
MGKIDLRAALRPSGFMRRMLRHSDVSEGTKFKVIAKRQILKRIVTFYHNGLRVVEGTDLNEQEMHESEILRLAHASILVGAPVGDKKACWVNATVNPVSVWVYGMPIEEFLATSQRLVETQQLGIEFLLEEPVRKVMEKRNGRNVRLFGKQPSHAHLSHQLLVETEHLGDLSVDDKR